MAQNGKSPVDPTRYTPEPLTDQTASIHRFEELTGWLNFLDTIGDFSDMVDLYAKCDQIAHSEPPTGIEGSQKKCRNCS